ncbi:MAG: TetR/AcrR family transcriptional regulator [Tunicatimonas sp.]|uniref:TetR/AcrR family transcriptional regulator n=1 Tax=Tunicatimonas sp. TaxID=1940096 RepID=UPI003C73C796
MKVGSKHQSAEMRRQQILSAADLVLIDAGIEDFTIDQVAERANIAKGTIYKYFKSKDEILGEISTKAVSLLLQAFQQATANHTHSVEKLKAICWAAYRYYQSYSTYHDLLAHIERPDFNINLQEYVKISQSIQDFCEEIIVEGQRKGEINPNLNPQLLVRVIWATNIGVIQFVQTKQKLIQNIHETPMDEVINISVQMMTNGIAHNKKN